MWKIMTFLPCCSWHTYATVVLALLILGRYSEAVAASDLTESHIDDKEQRAHDSCFLREINKMLVISGSFKAKGKPIAVSDDEDYRCYACRTDMGRIKHDGVRSLINQYLETSNPSTGIVNENCDGRGNITLMNHESCPVRACFKMIVDDKKGIPYIIRGCASTFFGYTPEQFAEQNAKPENLNKFSSCQITPSEWHFEHCFCQDSLCNGTERRNLLSYLFLVTSVTSLLFALFKI